MKNIINFFMFLFLFGTIVISCGGNPSGANAASSPAEAVETPAPAVEEIVETGTVATALPIVYRLPDGSTKVLPHLDLSLKRHVIGIWSGGMAVGLKNYRGNWARAMSRERARNLGPEWELPERGVGARFSPERDRFNQTVVTLREDGIDADPWLYTSHNDRYWTRPSSTDPPTRAYLFHLQGAGGGTWPKESSALVRYVRKDIRR
jgi:hypothetical protein